jgi:hypothetical protein
MRKMGEMVRQGRREHYPAGGAKTNTLLDHSGPPDEHERFLSG